MFMYFHFFDRPLTYQEQYAELVLQDGFFLSLLDLVLLADSRDCSLMLISHENGAVTKPQNVYSYLQELLPATTSHRICRANLPGTCATAQLISL